MNNFYTIINIKNLVFSILSAFLPDQEDSETTIADLVDDYIKGVKDVADVPSGNLEITSYKKIEDYLYNEVTGKATLLDEKIAEIKKAAEKNQEAYMEAYRAAVEELKVYEDNAKAFNLTTEQLAYINSLISNTRGKIAEVTTAQEVVTAMTVFRNAVAEYYSDFDQHQIEEIRKIAVAKLEEYNDLSADIDNSVAKGVAAVKSQTTVGGIQTELQKALDEINGKIKNNALLTAQVEARAKFYVFLEDNDEDGEYSNEIHEIASRAIDAINAASNVRDVDHAVEDYMAQIDEELAKRGTSLAQEVKKAQEKTKEQIALYKELANTITDAAKKQELLNTIKLYEDSILSKDATLNSIAKDEKALREFIETFEVKLVSAKVNAIEYIKAIGDEYFKNTGSNATKIAALTALNEKYMTEGQLDYEKLIKDPYMAKEFKRAIESIKNAKKVEDLEEPTSSDEDTVLANARYKIVNVAVKYLNTMEVAKAEVTKQLTGGEPTILNDFELSDGAKAKAKTFLKNYYDEHIANVTLDVYDEDNTIFTTLTKNAKTALTNYLNGEIKKEAQSNLNVTSVNETIKNEHEDLESLLNEKIDNVQKDIGITTNSKGEGKVTGTLIKQSNNDFTKNFTMKTGYYLVLSFTSETAKKITYERTGASTGKGELDDDRILVIWFEDDDALEDTKLVISFYGDDNKTPIQTISISDFTDLVLKDK